MNFAAALDQRSRVEAFQRKHRVGLVTLLFTDVVGSTKLKSVLGDDPALNLIERHHALVREVLAGFDEGEEISTAGDSFFIVFTRPSDAVKFSLFLQSRLRQLSAEVRHEIADRIGVHVGEVLIAEDSGAGRAKDLYGMQVDICSRVSATAQGNQILMTRFAFDSARQVLKGEDLEGLGPVIWLSHGRYRLKGVEDPIEICAVGEKDRSPTTRPASTEKSQRLDAPDDEPVLGWRPAMDQVVPQTRWRLENMLGEGGFGEVWLAHHQVLGDRCVFKFCFRADRARSLKREVTLFRLMKERFAANPHFITVRDVFFDEPPYYIAMDYSESQDLRAWCEERGGAQKVPLPTRLEIIAQVADALQVAHDAGVIHRDVKPGNILVSGSGAAPDQVQVKLTDFGIGQVVSQEVLAGLSKVGFTVTAGVVSTGSASGTQMFMAPELVAGRAASAASDAYALGVVFYQLLLGDFMAPLTVDWADDIKEPWLREELARCFAGNPKRRFSRIAQLGQNLRAKFLAHPLLPSDAEEGRGEGQATAPLARAGDREAVQPRSPGTAPGLIDLAAFYNAALTDDWCNRVGHSLASLPRGPRVQIGGTDFDARGIVQVGFFQVQKFKAAYPQRVSGIPIRCRCRRVHFLHAALGREPDGTRIGSYIIHYAGGRAHELPILYGEDLRCWLFETDSVREVKRASIAWTGRTVGMFLHSIRLFKLAWTNPSPDEEIASLDFQAAMTAAAPFLVALTVE